MAGSTSSVRLLLAAALLSAWLVALLAGWSLGGGVHLALVVAVAVFPWRTTARR
ncbi:MAG: hypothetical protein R3244_01195 [Thermoanaerobaculia bacterium]|nr:hypothetical protein [Thermoanaerobaculia bacterium]